MNIILYARFNCYQHHFFFVADPLTRQGRTGGLLNQLSVLLTKEVYLMIVPSYHLDRNPTYERYRWQIFIITWLAYAGFYFTRKSFSVAKIALEKEPIWFDLSSIACYRETSFGMTSVEMAWIDLGYLLVYAIGQFLCGILGDKFGTRIVISVGMFGSILAAVAMGASSVTILFGIFFCLQGLCQSTGWAPLSKNIGNFFSERERGTILGLWCTNYALGGVLASAFAGFVAMQFCNWRYAFFFPAAVLLVIWVLFLLFQHNKPEDLGLPPIEDYHGEAKAVLKEGESDAEEPEGSWKVILEVISNPMVLLLSAIYFFLKPARYAILFWGPMYLNEKLGANIFQAGWLSSLFELAGPLSVFLGGYLSDRVFGSRRMPVSIICLFLLSIMLFFLDQFPATYLSLGLSFFLIGFLLYAPDSLVSGIAAIDFGTKKGASTAAGLINGFGSIGAIIGGTIPGFFKDQWGWDGIFMMLGGATLLATILLIPKWNALPPKAVNG
jgi:OPA family sugar phosphate sensor protein UhpC-like MFS transporter